MALYRKRVAPDNQRREVVVNRRFDRFRRVPGFTQTNKTGIRMDPDPYNVGRVAYADSLDVFDFHAKRLPCAI